LAIRIARVNWFSTYHVHHRVASHFRQGRAFLLGDAAHIHSPVGGQGMNTGIGDAINLSWKLADVVRGRANPKILATYETERIAFARRLVATTDRGFSFINNDGALARFVRLRIVPYLLPALFSRAFVRKLMFRTISQTNVNYRGGGLDAGAGSVRGGDRLPWIRLAEGSDNFASLRSLAWQAHVYGEASSGIEDACDAVDLPLVKFDWSEAAASAGLARSALYLVRPDGYVALAAERDAATALSDYVARFSLRFGPAIGKPARSA
jgi:hypothetical protein